MDLDLKNRKVSLWGTGALADHCASLFAAEGAALVEGEADISTCDVLVAIAPRGDAPALDTVDNAAAFAGWDHVTGLAARCRAATEGMAARGYGRIVWVGPIEVKFTRDDPAADLDAVVGLGALGLLKAVSGEVGPDGITCNSVLWNGGDVEAAGHAVLFFASQPSGYVTGTALSIDGGAGGSVF